MQKPRRCALVLAAGKSIRFNSSTPKVLHSLCGKPMIEHVLDRLETLELDKTLVVTGHDSERIREALAGRSLEFILQVPQLGTGHAVMTAQPQLAGIDGSLLIVYADTPQITTETLRELLETQSRQAADQVLLTCHLENPTGYGRILRTAEGEISRIVEERDASPEERLIREVNPGFYCFQIPSLREGLKQLDTRNVQGEYYLTDLAKIFRESGKKVVTVTSPNPEETVGINDRFALSEAETTLRAQILRRHMLKGVTILRPESVTIDHTVSIGRDTTIYPGAILEGKTRIGCGCRIGPWTQLQNVVLGNLVRIESSCVIRDSRIGDNSTVGPFAHLRQGVEIGHSARIGNFVEIKKSRLGDGAKSAHLTYLGDSEIGDRVNIGAGVITCNYDGWKKSKTIIEAEAFVGSDSQLLAPVTVGKGAYIASGSTITEDVPAGALAIGRSRQKIKEGWARKRKESEKQKRKSGGSAQSVERD